MNATVIGVEYLRVGKVTGVDALIVALVAAGVTLHFQLLEKYRYFRITGQPEVLHLYPEAGGGGQ